MRGVSVLSCEENCAALVVFRAILPEERPGAKIIENRWRHCDVAASVSVLDQDDVVLQQNSSADASQQARSGRAAR